MSDTINIFEAITNFSRIAARIHSGEQQEAIIAKNGVPYVKIVPLDYGLECKPRMGAVEGQFTIPEDFDDIEVNFSLEENP